MIDGDALIPAITDLYEPIDPSQPMTFNLAQIKEVVDAMPTVEPKRGEWVRVEETRAEWRCSNCNDVIGLVDSAITPTDNDIYFCPNCGADMRGETK